MEEKTTIEQIKEALDIIVEEACANCGEDKGCIDCAIRRNKKFILQIIKELLNNSSKQVKINE